MVEGLGLLPLLVVIRAVQSRNAIHRLPLQFDPHVCPLGCLMWFLSAFSLQSTIAPKCQRNKPAKDDEN
jgi:hypothetical protein